MHGLELGDEIAGLAPDRVEEAARIDRSVADGQVLDRFVGVRVPGVDGTRDRVERGGVLAG